jgi:hypothetical protein
LRRAEIIEMFSISKEGMELIELFMVLSSILPSFPQLLPRCFYLLNFICNLRESNMEYLVYIYCIPVFALTHLPGTSKTGFGYYLNNLFNKGYIFFLNHSILKVCCIIGHSLRVSVCLEDWYDCVLFLWLLWFFSLN